MMKITLERHGNDHGVVFTTYCRVYNTFLYRDPQFTVVSITGFSTIGSGSFCFSV